jgi:putative transcriptional regulator
MIPTTTQQSSFIKQIVSGFLLLSCLFMMNPRMISAFLAPSFMLSSPTSALLRPTLGHGILNSALCMTKKSSDRAHIERNLEDMMGNDWREFRAKLVAQEQAAETLRLQATQQLTLASARRGPMSTDPQLYYHAHEVINHGQAAHTLPQQPSYMKDMPPTQSVGDLFAGSINIFDGYRISGKNLQCSDPFVSEDELPIMMQKEVTINKHRWAHVIPSPEPGSVLISNTMFHQTVVLVISHCDVKGSTGIVINRYVVSYD